MTIEKSSLIEGIGDEVLIITAIFAVVIIFLIVWLTKSINILPISIQQLLHSNHEQSIPNSISNQANELISAINPINSAGDKDNTIEAVEKEVQSSSDLLDNDQSNNSNDINVPDASIQIKIIHLDESVKTINIDPSITISNFKSRYFKAEIDNNKNVRLIFNGKELKENNNSTMSDYGVVNGSTLHCLITQKKQTVIQTPISVENASVSTEIHMGSLLFPMLGLLLSYVWYYQLNYKQYFSIASSFVLITLTIIYFIGCFFNYSTSPNNLNSVNGPADMPTADASTSMDHSVNTD